MFSQIKKLWRYLCYFFQTKKVWTWPQQSKILIYDAANSEILLEYLKPWNPEILHVRKEKINIWIFLKALFKKSKGHDAYIDCFIEQVRPRLVITIVDNNTTFYKISKRHPNTKTLFVQNGMRGYYEDVFGILESLDSDTISTFFVDYMLVFGSVTGERYSQYLKGRILSVGSIKNNLVRKENSSQPGVIAFISMSRFPSGIFIRDRYFSYEDFWVRPDTFVIQRLMHYARENDKRLLIIPNFSRMPDLLRREETIAEIGRNKDYFRKLMGIEPEFSEASGPYNNYKAVDSAEVVVSMDSTLGYESIGRGQKTAIFPIRGTLLELSGGSVVTPSSSFLGGGRDYGWPGDFPDEGPFWTNKPDPDSFIRILDYLFGVSDEQWKKDVETTNFSSIMEYDSGNTIFQSILETELGPPPSSAR